MRRLLCVIIAVFLLCAVAEASWRMNPHTRKLDYYEATTGGGADAVAGIVLFDYDHEFAFNWIVRYEDEVVWYAGD